jgi:hypothetical protein
MIQCCSIFCVHDGRGREYCVFWWILQFFYTYVLLYHTRLLFCSLSFLRINLLTYDTCVQVAVHYVEYILRILYVWQTTNHIIFPELFVQSTSRRSTSGRGTCIGNWNCKICRIPGTVV